MLRLVAIMIAGVALAGCKEQVKDPQQVEFERKFEREAVLVRTCPGDPRYASGPTAAAQRVYRFEKELWFIDIDGPRKLETNPEAACSTLTLPPDPKPAGIPLPGGLTLQGPKT
ncbi:hypothetical protein ABIB90_002908 [Bradyrhizobium sp. JR4.1]|uniref:hypothetical protein n=1 Tax=Bradyrhizobium sp. JR4.1 TaxID=3156372 RepID=UPI0033930B2F